MLLSTLERNRPKLQIKRRMLRRVHDAMKLKQRLQLRHSPVVGLYFHRNHMSSSCNSVDNLDFVSINGRANPAPYKGRGTAFTPTSDPSHSIKRISSSSNPTSPEDKSTSPSPTTHHRPRVRNIDRPGMKFVTIFCDDQKVTSHLHAYILYTTDLPSLHVMLTSDMSGAPPCSSDRHSEQARREGEWDEIDVSPQLVYSTVSLPIATDSIRSICLRIYRWYRDPSIAYTRWPRSCRTKGFLLERDGRREDTSSCVALLCSEGILQQLL